MAWITPFLTALVITLLVAGLGSLAIRALGVDRTPRFGGFCIGLGWALARYSTVQRGDAIDPAPIAAAVGALIALILFWLFAVRNRDTRP
jgi:hypothetical protein